MKATFIDTSFLIALLVESDAMHERAIAWQRHIKGPKVTTEFIFIELLDALTADKLKPLAVQAVDLLRRDPLIEIVSASSATLHKGLQFLRCRLDKRWGLTDCISFTVMADAGLTDCLTADHHFQQAGFKALLLQDP